MFFHVSFLFLTVLEIDVSSPNTFGLHFNPFGKPLIYIKYEPLRKVSKNLSPVQLVHLKQLNEICLKDKFQLIYKNCLKIAQNLFYKAALRAKLGEKPLIYLRKLM